MTGPVFAPVFVQGRWVYMSSTIGHFPRLVQVAIVLIKNCRYVCMCNILFEFLSCPLVIDSTYYIHTYIHIIGSV